MIRVNLHIQPQELGILQIADAGDSSAGVAIQQNIALAGGRLKDFTSHDRGSRTLVPLAKTDLTKGSVFSYSSEILKIYGNIFINVV